MSAVAAPLLDQRLVMKFGGTSMANLEQIEHTAQHILAARSKGYRVCVVVSAMAGETDRLAELAAQAGDGDVSRAGDYDAVLASGEQVSAGLLALMLTRLGAPAKSWQGWQIGLKTDNSHGQAAILQIDEDPIGTALGRDEIAVVAGFQGISPDARIATLGRGGSDTTAVAVAVALGAVRCDIYTDVDGVYTADPRIVPSAQRLDKISYEEMLEMASQGAKVLQTRSVGLAMIHKIPLRVLSSFDGLTDDPACTHIVDEDEIMERRVVSAVVPNRTEAKLSLMGVPNIPGRSALIFTALADAKVNIDMIVQSQARTGEAANLSITLREADLARAQGALAAIKDEVGYTEVFVDQNVSKVSIIGVGMNDHTGVAAKMFQTLADRGINIQNIATSEIKISVLIPSEYTELAVRTLHDAFSLGEVR